MQDECQAAQERCDSNLSSVGGISVLQTTRTRLPPCAVRIVDEEYILVGGYELDKLTGYRTGTIEVYNDELRLQKSYETYGAVLDLKLNPFEQTLVGTAHSTGNIMLWRFEQGALELLANLQVFEPDVLITSLSFSPTDRRLIVVTTTAGSLKTIDIETGELLMTSNSIKKIYEIAEWKKIQVQGKTEVAVDVVELFDQVSKPHSLECWTAEFGFLPPLENVIFSGGDDCAIQAHDIRSGEFIWSNKSLHTGGVVAIKSSTWTFRSHMPTSIITGSYDDYIRSFDLRMLADSIFPGEDPRPLNIHELNLGGGVWRFSESPSNTTLGTNELLACCMYDGAKVVSLKDHQFTLKTSFKKGHESICYGGDWCSRFVATSSFYDKSLQLWKP
ncbi:diphthamide synthase Ecym_2255 [Eremothecium cymbalariae DBVPG|uniref:methylated diphthine methylhydrolase n=1 Tax=Eremothecium cymbalariae (strain CBS 270.75 / DBVPG 7215 / KCTC 17166 / NRRL Y-17582) TaxID=931890 RepID=G8JPP6_ERECY|nr:Hypothetical protein Ecym_2255 [Eremothecium cymbalariae DBVPG\